MKDSVLALFYEANWQGTTTEVVPNPLGPEFPPVEETVPTGYDLDIILCIARVIPGFIVVMNDMQIFYYVIGSIFGVLKGLLQLNLGSISSFQELVLTFHKAPLYWWNRGISTAGAANIKERVGRVMSRDINGAPVNAFETAAESARRKASAQDAALLSEQIFDATSVLSAKMKRADSNISKLHLEDNSLPVWLAFSDIWNAAIFELRDLDLISNKERDCLKFEDIIVDETTSVIPGMRPIMLPIFFYGGQVTRALESPGDDPTQSVVLAEIKALVIYILAQTNIVTEEQAIILSEFETVRKTSKLEHKAKRVKGINEVTKLCQCMKTIMDSRYDEASRTRVVSLQDLRDILVNLSDSVRYEVDFVLSRHKKPARGPNETDASRIMHSKAADLANVLDVLQSKILSAENWGFFWGEEGGLNAFYGEAVESSAKSNVQKVVSHLEKMLTISAKGAQPRGEEALRILSFFMGSLKNPTLEKPPSLDEMLSWTVLTPHYSEDVLYALNSKEVAAHFDMDGMSVQGLSDLMTPNEDGVTVMAWLRSNYPSEWENLMERLAPALQKARIEKQSVRESDFDEGGPLAPQRMELLQWASYRGQHLSRTVRGMMAYEKALRLLAKVENPNPGVSGLRYNSSIDDLVRSKFSYVVSSQIYGELRRANDPKKRWIARGIEILLHQHPGLRVAFLDSVKTSSGKVQYSVLTRARLGTPVDDIQSTDDLYRIRLPVNRLPNAKEKGIILGEGKPENQNASIIFCFGEAIQAIDMNQDNYFFEALKMRSLINEFNPPRYTEDTWKSALTPYAKRASGPNRVAIQSSAGSATMVANGHPPPFQNEDIPTAASNKISVTAYEKPWPDMKNMPVSLIGFREWIFSQDSGALGSFAAATEFTFGSMIQRIMTWPGGVRFHYGHPDLWNKLFVMTRGGVSKATKYDLVLTITHPFVSDYAT